MSKRPSPRRRSARQRLHHLASALPERYRRDRDGRQRWLAWPITREDLEDPAYLLGRLWPDALKRADAMDPPSIPTGEVPEILSHAEMMRRDPGAALWRPGSWWFVLNIREQTPGDTVEIALDARVDHDEE